MNLASAKQRAAATVLDIDGNKFALLGVAGKEVYGILNDPNLPAAITAAAVGTGDSTKWEDKTTVQIYNDILALFSELVAQSAGLIDQNTPLRLCLSPGMSVKLGAATGLNCSAAGSRRQRRPDRLYRILRKNDGRPHCSGTFCLQAEIRFLDLWRRRSPAVRNRPDDRRLMSEKGTYGTQKS